MIRFLNLKDQICEGQSDFAFWDTERDTFLCFGPMSDEVFSTKEGFINSYWEEAHKIPISRFLDIIPDNFFDKPERNQKEIKNIEVKNKDLLNFIKSTKYHLNKLDKLMKMRESLNRGKLIAKEMNRFNHEFDLFLYVGLDIRLSKLESVLDENFKI